jgi:hypothetical protein
MIGQRSAYFDDVLSEICHFICDEKWTFPHCACASEPVALMSFRIVNVFFFD